MLTLLDRAPIIEASKAKISFLSLPAELRNRIYEMVLIKGRGEGAAAGDESIDVVWDGREGVWSQKIGEQPWMRQPRLTAVCRQIRDETLPIYYGQNTFELDVHAFDSTKLLRKLRVGSPAGSVVTTFFNFEAFQATISWLRVIGHRNARLIRRFEIKMSAERRSQPSAVLSSLVPHTEVIEQGIRRLFERHSLPSPPTMSIMTREVAVNTKIYEEYKEARKNPNRGWKELLLVRWPAAESEASTPTD